MKPTRITAAAAALTALAVALPAGAQQAAKPEVSCFGAFATDRAGDATRSHPAFAGDPGQDNLDLTEAFFTETGGQTYVNIRVKDLDKTIPPGSTSAQWQLNYGGAAEGVSFVRAVIDFAGIVTYDFGGAQETPATTVNAREGGTTGGFFEGPNGIVQIAIPKEKDPAGTTLKGLSVYAYEPVQALPPAAPTPVKGGQLYEQDTASGRGSHTVGQPCPATPPSTGDPGTNPPSQQPPADDSRPLPVEVLTKSVKRGRTLPVKLRASEPLTQVAAQLRKGSRVYGKGSLAKLSGTRTLKLKAKRVKKGGYVLDLAGTDSEGARRFLSTRLKVR